VKPEQALYEAFSVNAKRRTFISLLVISLALIWQGVDAVLAG